MEVAEWILTSAYSSWGVCLYRKFCTQSCSTSSPLLLIFDLLLLSFSFNGLA